MEFLSLGIGYGQRVTLTLRDMCDNIKKVDCHFGGFRLFAGKTKVFSSRDVVPVFNVSSKNGRMLNKHIYESTMLENIIHVSVSERSLEDIDLSEDVRSLWNTSNNICSTCASVTRKILRDMSVLFPGKKVYIDMENERVGAVRYHKHGSDAVDIAALCYRDGHLLYDIESEYYNEKDVEDGLVDLFSEEQLLDCVLSNIRVPYVPEDCTDAFFNPEEQTWKDIPDVRREDMPELFGTYALQELRADQWFGSLTEEEKEKTFGSLRDRYARKTADGAAAGLTFCGYIDFSWKKMKPTWKPITLDGYLKRLEENETE